MKHTEKQLMPDVQSYRTMYIQEDQHRPCEFQDRRKAEDVKQRGP